MSTKSEAQDIQFQGLRPKIPWYIAMGNALWRNPNMLIGLIFTSLVAIIALLAPLLNQKLHLLMIDLLIHNYQTLQIIQ